MDLIKHVAKHHCKEVPVVNDMKDQSEIDMDKDEHKKDEHEEKTNKETSFVFSESMLDEFIQ